MRNPIKVFKRKLTTVIMLVTSGLDGINGAKYSNRIDQLLRTVPDVFTHKTVLYIGANPFRNELVQEFKAAGCTVDLVEAHKSNFDFHVKKKLFDRCFFSDVRDFNPKNKYDVVVFWHGIEHLEKTELPQFIENIKKYADKMILFGCPYGEYEQGAAYGNPYEHHVSHWNEKELIEAGLNVSSIGKYNSRTANLISYIRL